MKNCAYVLLIAGLFLTFISCNDDDDDATTPNYTLTVAVTPTNWGSVTKLPSQNQYLSGTNVTITAVPEAGFKFVRWEGDLSGASNPTTLTINGNKNIIAVFEAYQHTLNIAVSPSNGGSVTKSPNQNQYTSGTTVTLTATPAAGYQFTRWQGDVTATSSSTTITMNANKNITAVFTAVTSQYTLNIAVSPTNGGSMTKSPNQNQYASGTTVTLTATPATGYQFTRWEGGITGTSNPTTITMNDNKDVTAVFTANQYTLNIINSPSNGGSVTKSPNQNQYASGTTVTLTASPAAGYQFTRWEDDVTGTSSSTMITMNANKNVTAVFTAIANPLIQLSKTSLTFTANDGGTAPVSQTINITNGSTGTLSGLSISFPDGTPLWLSKSLNHNTAPAVLTVRVSMSNPLGGSYPPGTYTTRMGVASTNATNSPQYITVTFTILPSTEIIAYASYDNSVASSSLDSKVANTVYSNSALVVGIDYAWVLSGGYNSFITGSAIKFNIQSQISGRNIATATLRLYVELLRGDFSITPKIKVSAFSNDWSSNTLTFNSFKNLYVYNQGQVFKDAPSNRTLPLDFNVTTIVQNWASGTFNNYGFSLTPENHSYPGYSSLQTTFFQSIDQGKFDSPDKRPQLIIQFK